MEPFSIALMLSLAEQADKYTGGWAKSMSQNIAASITDRFLSKKAKSALDILKNRQDKGMGNHDLMKALRRSMLEATLEINAVMKEAGEETEFTDKIQKWTNAQLKQVKNIESWHDWENPAIKELELFFDEVDNYKVRKNELVQKMTTGWLKYLEIQQGFPDELPKAFTLKLLYGWEDEKKTNDWKDWDNQNDPDENKNLITWWNLVMIIFKTTLRKGETEESRLAEKALVHNFLSELKLGVDGIGQRLDTIKPELDEILSILKKEHPSSEAFIDEEWYKTFRSLIDSNKVLADTNRLLVENTIKDFQKLVAGHNESRHNDEDFIKKFESIARDMEDLRHKFSTVNVDLSENIYITDPNFLAFDLKTESLKKFNEFIQANKTADDINESILPTTRALKEIIPLNNSGKPNLVTDVEILWDSRRSKSNILLSGEGGAGKTFSLYNLWKYYLENDAKVIPLFIPLKNIKTENSNILDEIISMAFDQSIFIGATNEVRRNIVNSIFNNEYSEYKFLVILDGLNEMPNPKFIEAFLEKSIRKWKCVQIVMSSRHQYNTEILNNFTYIKLNRLSGDTIKEYLKDREIVRTNDTVIRLLYNPMRLTLYSDSNHQIESIKDEINDKSEIELLRQIGNVSFSDSDNKNEVLFFKKRDSFYSKGELTFDYVLSLCVNEVLLNKEDFESFSIQYLLPFIGYYLEQHNRIGIEDSEIIRLVNESELISTAARQKQISSESLKEILNMCFSKLTLLVLQEQEDKNMRLIYEFQHQEFRDFFSAVWIWNSLKRWNSSAEFTYDSIPAEIKTAKISKNVLEYLAQIDGEHRNIPVIGEDNFWSTSHYTQTEIKLSLNKFKKKFDKKKLGYAVENLINAMIVVKSDFSADDLSQLYLTGIDLSNLIFSRRNETLKSDRIHCSFDESKLELKDFFPKGHKPQRKRHEIYTDFYDNKILSINIAEDGKSFTSGTKSDLIEWDIATGKLIHKKSIPYMLDHALHNNEKNGFFNREAGCSPIDVLISVSNECLTITTENEMSYYAERDENLLHHGYRNRTNLNSGWLTLWDLKSGNINRLYYIFRGGWYCYDKNSRMLAVTSVNGKSVEIWDDKQRKLQWESHSGNINQILDQIGDAGLVSKIEYETLIKGCFFHQDANKLILVTASEDEKIIEWDCHTGQMLKIYPAISSKDEFVLGFTPDGLFLITSNSARSERIEYEKKQSQNELLTEAFDIIDYKSESYGNLRFWSREDGALSKELKTEGHSLIKKIAFLDHNYKEAKTEFKYFITGNQNGELILYDYETFEVSQVFSGPLRKLSPVLLKYRELTNIFIATYREGYIKMFSSQTQVCIASSKGDLKFPGNIKSYGFHLAVVIDVFNASCEIWNLTTFTRKNNRKLILGSSDFPYVELNPKNTRIYNCRSTSLNIWDFNYTVDIYDMEDFEKINSLQINGKSLDKEYYFISPNDKYILFLSRMENEILLYNIEDTSFLGAIKTNPIRSMILINETELIKPDQTEMKFFVTYDKGCGFIYFDESTLQFNTREDENLKQVLFPKHSTIEQYVKNNKAELGLINNLIITNKPKEHTVYSWTLNAPTVKELNQYVEPFKPDPIFGEPYGMERSFDYNFTTNTSLHLFQDSFFEHYTVEDAHLKRKIFQSYHDDSTNLAIYGCKFPMVDTRFSHENRELAMRLEKNDAVFKLAYHIVNYPNTYVFEHLKAKGERLTFIEIVRVFIAIVLVRLFSIPIYIKNGVFKQTNKAIRQNFSSPYNSHLKIYSMNKSGTYYKSVLFKS